MFSAAFQRASECYDLRFVMNEIRWTREEAEGTRDGISLESLELSPADRAGFQLCRLEPSLGQFPDEIALVDRHH